MSRLVVSIALLAAACGGAGDGASSTTGAPISASVASRPETTGPGPADPADRCADVLAVDLARDGDTYRVTTTVRSGDTGWEKYADAWEIRTTDGVVLGTRELAHPHETEQPFTRSLGGVEIPDDVTEVVIVARDSVLGFCGDPLTVAVPRP